MKVIVYTRQDGGVSVIRSFLPTKVYEANKNFIPTEDLTQYLIDLWISLGEKDVPPGIDFWIVEESDLPSRETRDFWKLENMGTPNGKGLSLSEFTEQYPDYKNPGGTWE